MADRGRAPENGALAGVIMGSSSDWPTLKLAAQVLADFEIPYERAVVSAHRTPEWMSQYASSAANRGLKVIIAGAGGAAHLPGMVAAYTLVPVIGVPVRSRNLHGVDSLLSIVQMPAGVPVATMSIGEAGATNAGLLAAQIIGLLMPEILIRLQKYREQRAAAVRAVQLDDLPAT